MENKKTNETTIENTNEPVAETADFTPVDSEKDITDKAADVVSQESEKAGEETKAEDVTENETPKAEEAAAEEAPKAEEPAANEAPKAEEAAADKAPKEEEKEPTPEETKNKLQKIEANLKSLLEHDVREMQKIEKRRSVEIMAVFAKHNFYVNGMTPVELRTTLEDLGPTYVKIGQIMSSRVDILPEHYCKELEKLRQNVQELDPKLARAVIERESGHTIDELFTEFRDKPLGSASVGQAHYAVLKDGRKVVCKVQRPLIADMMRKDFIMLRKMANVFNVVTEGSENSDEQVDLVSVLDEFEKVTNEELDFRIEARNTKFFKEHCIVDETKVTCPDVIDELTTERLFTMTFVDGYSVSAKDRIIADGYDVDEIGANIVDNYVHQILDVGVFHADPHQGNIMVSHGIPVWIDFGMIGRITDGDINTIQTLVMAVLEKDAESLANGVMSMGAATEKTNRDRLIEDIDIYLDKYCTVTSLDDLDMSVLFDEIMNLAAKHHVKMPGKFTMLVRSLTTIEGVIEQLCPSLNLFKIVSEKMMDRAKKSFDLENELISAGKDVLEVGKKAARIPALAADALKGINRGRMKMNMEFTGYEELVNQAADTIKNIVMAFFACVLFFGSCILCTADIRPKAPGGIPAIAAVGMMFSIALAIHTIRKFSRK